MTGGGVFGSDVDEGAIRKSLERPERTVRKAIRHVQSEPGESDAISAGFPGYGLRYVGLGAAGVAIIPSSFCWR